MNNTSLPALSRGKQAEASQMLWRLRASGVSGSSSGRWDRALKSVYPSFSLAPCTAAVDLNNPYPSVERSELSTLMLRCHRDSGVQDSTS